MADLMEAVTSLAKRRGIAFQSSEIYGGQRAAWEDGPPGVELRRDVAPLDSLPRQRPQPAPGKGAARHGRPDGGRHLPRETSGDRVPVERDLRRAAVVVGLRPARRRASTQRPNRMVALDGAAPR